MRNKEVNEFLCFLQAVQQTLIQPNPNLESAIAILPTSISPHSLPEQFSDAATLVSNGATKITLLFQGQPTEEEAQGVFSDMAGALVQISASYHNLLKSHNSSNAVLGMCLQTTAFSAVRSVLSELSILITSLLSENYQETCQSLPILTGRVWAAANTFKAVPLDNMGAVRTEIGKWSETIQDAFNEVKELIKLGTKTEPTEHEKEERKSDDDDDAEDDEIGDAFCEDELKRATCCFVFIKYANNLVKMVQTLVKLSVGNDNTKEVVGMLDKLVFAVKSIASLVDDVVCLLHPPHDVEPLLHHSKELHTALLNLMDTIEMLNCTLFSTVKKNNSSKIMELMRKQLLEAIQDLS